MTLLGYQSEQRKSLSLGLAKERLETFDVIGLVEQFEQSLELLAYTFGFPPILEVPYVNVDPQRASRQAEVKQSTLDYIAETNREEMELYEYAQKLFQERLEHMRAEKAQADDIAASSKPSELPTSVFFDFRRVNPGRGWYFGERDPVHGVVRWSKPTTSYVELPVAVGRDLILRVRIVFSIRRLFRYPRLSVNGYPIPLRLRSFEKGEMVYEGIIPADVAQRSSGWLQLAFSVGGPSIPFLHRLPASEQRELGLCYHSLQVEPVSLR